MSSASENKTSSEEVYNQLGLAVAAAKERVNEQEAVLMALKSAQPVDKPAIRAAGKLLNELREAADQAAKAWRRADPNKLHLSKDEFDSFLARRFFYIPSNSIYPTVAGLYDYGPPACAIQSNLLRVWRQHFVLEENMLEIESCCVTPSRVFEVSGHVERFFDYMVRDIETKECYRVDKLIEDFAEEKMADADSTEEELDRIKEVLNTLDDNNGEQFDALVTEFGIMSPEGNSLSESFPFNLMFKTTIGPTGNQVGYLRPETAQGIFVNFKRLYDYNHAKLPFAAATIGRAFRNEISPKAGLLRVREFTLAEIEHFMDPEDSMVVPPRYDTIKDLELNFFSRERQASGLGTETLSIEEAVEQGVLGNLTHAYFIGRTFLFLLKIGLLPSGIRFRQHLATEMAHYASDCWDAELLTTYGWYEVVGLADRCCFDVENHAESSKSDLYARVRLDEPIITKKLAVDIVRRMKGRFFGQYRADGQLILKKLQSMTQEALLEAKEMYETNSSFEITLDDGRSFTLGEGLLNFTEEVEKQLERKFIPAVIEPSFGVGRIMYALLEHSYWVRPDPEGKNKIPRAVLSLQPFMAPYATGVLTVQASPIYDPIIRRVGDELTRHYLSYRVDAGPTNIGRKYARLDEVGIPFLVTIDSVTLEDDTVTIRDRDTCTQIRIPMADLGDVMRDLVNMRVDWTQTQERYVEQEQTASALVGKGQLEEEVEEEGEQ